MSSRTATSAEYVYFDCPVCAQGIAEPFAITSGPVAFVHGHGKGSNCRLIVCPDPDGLQDRAWQVPRNKSLEEGLTEAVNAARNGGWLLTRSPTRET